MDVNPSDFNLTTFMIGNCEEHGGALTLVTAEEQNLLCDQLCENLMEEDTNLKDKVMTYALKGIFFRKALVSSAYSFFFDLGPRIAFQEDEIIPFPEKSIIIERVKASGFNDRKWVYIALILTHLRSLNRESFHAAQL